MLFLLLFLKCGLKKKSYPERLHYLKIDTLSNRRFKLDLSLCHKIYHGKIHCPDLLVRKTATRTLQHNHRLEKEIRGGKHRHLQFSNRVVTGWNLLPDAVIELSEDAFARAIGMRTKRASCPPTRMSWSFAAIKHYTFRRHLFHALRYLRPHSVMFPILA